jgi:hypothetical protein
MFKDRAIGSIKIPEGVPVLPGNLPVIGEHSCLRSSAV